MKIFVETRARESCCRTCPRETVARSCLVIAMENIISKLLFVSPKENYSEILKKFKLVELFIEISLFFFFFLSTFCRKCNKRERAKEDFDITAVGRNVTRCISIQVSRKYLARCRRNNTANRPLDSLDDLVSGEDKLFKSTFHHVFYFYFISLFFPFTSFLSPTLTF